MRLGHSRLRLVAAAFGVPWREVIRDARVAWTWNRPTDDLVVWLARQHSWCAEEVVLYLTALGRYRRRLGRARMIIGGD